MLDTDTDKQIPSPNDPSFILMSNFTFHKIACAFTVRTILIININDGKRTVNFNPKVYPVGSMS